MIGFYPQKAKKTKIKQTAWCSYVTFQVTFSALMRKNSSCKNYILHGLYSEKYMSLKHLILDSKQRQSQRRKSNSTHKV